MGSMPKRVPELGALAVKGLTNPGLHAVGGVAGLCLNVTSTGARSWILRTMIADKRREVGLGPFPDVGLAQARKNARELKQRISQGVDPVEERRAARAALIADQKKGLTFAQAFETFFAEKKAGELRNAKHATQWRSTMAQHAFPILGDMTVLGSSAP